MTVDESAEFLTVGNESKPLNSKPLNSYDIG